MGEIPDFILLPHLRVCQIGCLIFIFEFFVHSQPKHFILSRICIIQWSSPFSHWCECDTDWQPDSSLRQRHMRLMGCESRANICFFAIMLLICKHGHLSWLFPWLGEWARKYCAPGTDSKHVNIISDCVVFPSFTCVFYYLGPIRRSTISLWLSWDSC